MTVRMMTRLSQKRIALMWVAEGGNPHTADLASSVAMAESHGDTKIYNGVCCHGLYQFHQDYYPVKCATSPVCATRLAIKESANGTDWGKWEAYTNGAYKAYLGKSGVGDGRKLAAIVTPIGPDIPFPGPDIDPLAPFDAPIKAGESLYGAAGVDVKLSNPIEGIKNIAAFFTGLGELVLTPEGWVRTGKLVGGSILILWGLRVVVREGAGVDPVKAATKTATKVAETAAVAATVV